MSELEGPKPTSRIGAGTLDDRDPATSTAATPGRQSLASHDDKAASPGMFTGDEQWETIGLDDTAEAETVDDSMADVKAGLDEEMTALTNSSDQHTCFAGCVHGQFDSMMSALTESEAETSTGSPFKIAPGAVEEAARRAKPGDSPSEQAKASAQPLPLDHAQSTSDELGFAGTVSAGTPKGFPKTLGLARWNLGDFTYPALDFQTSKQPDKTWSGGMLPTTSADATTSAVATPAGTYDMGSERLKNPLTNKQVKLVRKLAVQSSAAAQIKDAEQEHLDDVSQAYKITIKAASDAVNAQSSTTFTAKTKAGVLGAAKKALAGTLHKKLGASPTKWRAMLRKCAALTGSGRDRSGWHSFRFFADAEDIDFAGQTITYKIKHNPNIKSVSSEDLIKIK